MSHELVGLLVAISLPMWLVAEQIIARKLFASETAERPSRGHAQVPRARDAVDVRFLNGSPNNSTGSAVQHQAA